MAEVLAPAGSRECLRAGLAAGADAIYFGLDEGFNARARAINFPREQLEEVVAEIHRGGARAYLTLNTVIFQSELAAVEQILRSAAAARVDAIILQDPAVALLARQICPDGPELHASTQMTISSPEAARFAQTLGITRVVLPRELSVQEIAAFHKASSMATEVFITGALCMSWSGQCLSSEAWGGRSANRGQCAQACRLPYELSVDGETRPLGDLAYLLSPQDLAGYRAVSSLLELGVTSLKIEGRQKDAEYVYHATRAVKNWIRAATEDVPTEVLQADWRDLALSYSRGFGDGFLEGGNHQTLVEGRSPRHRGLPLGFVVLVKGRQILVEEGSPEPPPSAEPRSPLPTPPLPPLRIEPEPGMGLVIQGMHAQSQEDEVGGPIFGVRAAANGWWLDMGARGPDLRGVEVGSQVFLTSDPQVNRRARQALAQPLPARLGLTLRVRGAVGEPLQVQAIGPGGAQARAQSSSPLGPAQHNALNEDILREKLANFGGTPYFLQSLELELAGGLFLPVSQLKALRRELVEQLERHTPPPVRLHPLQPAPAQTTEAPAGDPRLPRRAPLGGGDLRLVPLCRTAEQLEAVIEAGLPEVILDWMELVGLSRAFARARQAGLRVGVATVRVQKPLEEGYDRRLAALEPDSVLLRHWAGVMEFSQRPHDIEVHGDFSLNVTNALTGHHLLGLGLDTLTAAHDLDRSQVLGLIEAFPPERLAITLHHHIPTFHTEHCVYSHLLSQGRDYRSCGRPCEQHRLGLTDRKGITHPVIVDVGCRNTVFNGQAQSAARLVPEFLQRGVRHFRVEFVWEDRATTLKVLRAYQDLLQGRRGPDEALQEIGVVEQFGVTLGTMKVLTGL